MRLLPVTFVGAMALLLGSFPWASLFPPLADVVPHDWSRHALLVWQASSGITSLCLVVLIAHTLAVQDRESAFVDSSPVVIATVALVNYCAYVHLSDAPISLESFGPHGLLAAIVTAIFTSEFFFACLRLRQRYFGRRIYDLDPALNQAVLAIAPALLTVFVYCVLAAALLAWSPTSGRWVEASLAAANRLFDSEMPGLLLLALMSQTLWFFGVHGNNMLSDVYQAAFANDGVPGTVFSMPSIFLDLYASIGGSGATLGLLVALFFTGDAQRSEGRRVARYALLPSLFNINEIVLFGLPIVLNPIYLLPFLLVPMLQIGVSYLFVQHGLVAIDVAQVPWMTPPVLAGLLNAGSWRGGALQLLDLALSALVYAPFVCYAERRRKDASLQVVQRAVADIHRIKLQQRSVLDRYDEIGHAARKLLHEFIDDLGSPRVFLAYQPQHDSRGRVVGVEALIRWQHSYFGAIAPAVVCLLAEESGQIVAVGRWVMATACSQLRAWKDAGTGPPRVSVNLSPVQLSDAGLAIFLGHELRRAGLQASEIGLELTESQHVPDDAVSGETLRTLQAMGVHLEMDDFGMGYSSMLYVRRFRFAAIKLDGSLTRDVLQDGNCRDIIRSVVQLGRARGIRVVAEYVETREQQKALEELGCDEFQGYLYSPALAAEHCSDYIRRHCTPESA